MAVHSQIDQLTSSMIRLETIQQYFSSIQPSLIAELDEAVAAVVANQTKHNKIPIQSNFNECFCFFFTSERVGSDDNSGDCGKNEGAV